MKKAGLGSLGVFLFVMMAFSPLAVIGQNNPGKNAEEQHAWYLYTMYKQSKERAAKLELAIKEGNENIAFGAYGLGGGFTVDPKDVASVRRARELVEIENGRQKSIEAAWDRHFWGAYGALAEGYSKSKWHDKEKRNMDLIEWRLKMPFTPSANLDVPDRAPAAEPVTTPRSSPVRKPPVATSPAAADRVSATGAWALEKTEFVVEKVDAAFMQKFQPSESGGDGAGSAQSTFGHPDPKVNTVTVRMKVAWTSPPKVLVPGKEIDFLITVSDAGSDNPKGLGSGAYGSVGANCPSLSDVWSGPAAGFDLKLGERSKEANKAYTPPKAAPGTMLYIIADYGVYSRRQQFIYTYKFTLDAGNAPAPVSTSTAPRDKPQANGDRLGHEWSITEAVTYPGRWVRRSNSDVWDGTWNNGAVAVLSITIAGDKVKISRKDIGGSSIGATAIYEGTLAADGTMQGTETVTWPGHFTNQVQPWQGRIVK